MSVGDMLSTGLATMRVANQIEPRSAIPDSLLQPQSFTAKGISNTSTVDHHRASDRELRSVVERRFRRMNEAHDRIRAELLAAHPPQAE